MLNKNGCQYVRAANPGVYAACFLLTPDSWSTCVIGGWLAPIVEFSLRRGIAIGMAASPSLGSTVRRERAQREARAKANSGGRVYAHQTRWEFWLGYLQLALISFYPEHWGHK